MMTAQGVQRRRFLVSLLVIPLITKASSTRVFAADWRYLSGPDDFLVGERLVYVGPSKEVIVDWLVQYRNCRRLRNSILQSGHDPTILTDLSKWVEVIGDEARRYLSIPREDTAILATAADLLRGGEMSIEKHNLPGWFD